MSHSLLKAITEIDQGEASKIPLTHCRLNTKWKTTLHLMGDGRC